MLKSLVVTCLSASGP